MELQISGLLKHSTVVQVHRYCLKYFLAFYEFYVKKKKNTHKDCYNDQRDDSMKIISDVSYA